jgi:hypothetical protein
LLILLAILGLVVMAGPIITVFLLVGYFTRNGIIAFVAMLLMSGLWWTYPGYGRRMIKFLDDMLPEKYRF